MCHAPGVKRSWWPGVNSFVVAGGEFFPFNSRCLLRARAAHEATSTRVSSWSGCADMFGSCGTPSLRRPTHLSAILSDWIPGTGLKATETCILCSFGLLFISVHTTLAPCKQPQTCAMKTNSW